MSRMRPERLERERETFSAFCARLNPAKTVDRFTDLLEDLFLIRNPRFKFNPNYGQELQEFLTRYAGGVPKEEAGEWFYFPWNQTLAHYLPEAEHFELRTARNRNLITAAEQQALYGLTVAYAGLSVGSHGALTFALMGGGKSIVIADPDTVSPSNLNRIRLTFLEVGRKKSEVLREHLWQLDPYASITSFDDGVTEASMESFLHGANVLVEETDNLDLKISLRLAAREKKIPVIMATDNGDNVIVDIERFDLEPKRPLFHGALGDIDKNTFKSFPPHHLPKLATKVAGQEFIVERMLASLTEVGKTLYSWPQLGNAATLAGAAIATALKRLACGEELPSGKYEVNMDAALDPTYAYPERVKTRSSKRAHYLGALGIGEEDL